MSTILNDSLIQIWETNSWSLMKGIKAKELSPCHVAFNIEKKVVAYKSDDKTIVVMNFMSEIISILKDFQHVNNYIFSRDGNYLFTCAKDNDIRKWDVKTGKCVEKWKGHTSKVYDLDISPDGKYIVSVSHDGTIMFWDCQSGKCISSNKKVQYSKVKFSPHGDKVAMISLDDNKVTILNFPSLQQLIDETRERFKNRPLTPEERRKYYLE